jgi:hypothetical protein
MHCHYPTKDYVTRRTAEGKINTEIPALPQALRRTETHPFLLRAHLAQPPAKPGVLGKAFLIH